jgi:hypothetical protein
MNVDDLTAAESPHQGRWWYIIGALIPLVLFGAAAIGFIHTYVVPPTVAISATTVLGPAQPSNEPVKLASETTGFAQPQAAPDPPQPAASPQPEPASPDAPAGALPPSFQPDASVFPPPPMPPTATPQTWSQVAGVAVTSDTRAPAPGAAPDPAASIAGDVAPPEAGTPIAGPIPLPPHRPRFSVVVVRGPVPLPRARPTN